jgi:2-phospho-L-lactate/phosphoenolpyruvate guanylyltransferase
MKAIIPFKVVNPKSRLSVILSDDERKRLARFMLQDITATLRSAGLDVALLTTTRFSWDADVIVNEKDLNSALNEFLNTAEGPVMIAMADIPLLSKRNVEDIVSCDADLVICPGRGGGTNLQYIKDPARYRVDYYGASFLDHMQIAKDNNLKVEVFDSFNTSSDIDEPGDLVELYIHGRGEAAKYLRTITNLDTTKGRVRIEKISPNAAPSGANLWKNVALD